MTFFLRQGWQRPKGEGYEKPNEYLHVLLSKHHQVDIAARKKLQERQESAEAGSRSNGGRLFAELVSDMRACLVKEKCNRLPIHMTSLG